jgi:hypothetical protein
VATAIMERKNQTRTYCVHIWKLHHEPPVQYYILIKMFLKSGHRNAFDVQNSTALPKGIESISPPWYCVVRKPRPRGECHGVTHWELHPRQTLGSLC